MDTKSSLGFLRDMMQQAHLFDIPSYLIGSIRFQMRHFPTTSYFRYYSMLFYLFMYTHVDVFECLGLSLMAPNKQRKFDFDFDVAIRKRLDTDGYS